MAAMASAAVFRPLRVHATLMMLLASAETTSPAVILSEVLVNPPGPDNGLEFFFRDGGITNFPR